ncbi:hypothetical protein DFH08DRAFT_747973 [Mycena albidolilacea]|uniref:F-box domain-containing protein n=1 Tax=Mycena albidolilacea TaxID=1033008 RepID=A0AAD6ZVU6_9AGAR|nr:hypothetical protein DFH08DRAFT_747973 [Mycena albidolilacea]
MELNQSLRDRLAQIDIQISLLEGERKIVQKKLQSLKYPVLSLPFDVTSEIFGHCLPDLRDPESMLNFSCERLPTPLLLSQVCRAWRSVAFETPKIWATFHVSVDEWSLNSALASKRFACWIERAGPALLSFTLGKHPNHSSTPTSSAILLPIVAHSGQWRNVSLSLPYKDLISEHFEFGVHGRLPALETLQIQGMSAPLTPVDAFEEAPKLRAVVLKRIPPTLILLPWRQLTQFRGERLDAMECLHVLRWAVSLVECTFARVDEHMGESTLLPPHLPLTVLHLRGSFVCSDILAYLTLPSLRELHLDGDDGGSGEKFVCFLSRSRPPLMHLSLDDAYSYILGGYRFLLDLVVLDMPSLNVAEMSGLVHRLRDPAFLPKLASLSCSVWEWIKPHPKDKTSAINYGNLADALEFRGNTNNSGARLKSFRMKWQDSRDDPEDRISFTPPPDFRLNLPRLQNLVDEGMHISVIAEVGQLSEVWI